MTNTGYTKAYCPCESLTTETESVELESNDEAWSIIDSNNGNLESDTTAVSNDLMEYHSYNEYTPHNHETQYQCEQVHQYPSVYGDNIFIGNAHKYPSKSNFNLRPSHSNWKRK